MSRNSSLLPAPLLEELSYRSILITGANGLVGSTLIDALMRQVKECRVFAMCRNRGKAEKRFAAYIGKKNFNLIIQDVCEPLNEKIHLDFLVHAASPAHPTAFSAEPVQVMRANLLGTINLLEYCKGTNTRFLLISTGEIYGESRESADSFAEQDTGYLNSMDFRSCYPESKRAAETLCASYLRQYGTDTVVARLCYVYGPNIIEENDRADAQFLRKAVSGENIVLKSAGEQVRTYCYVKDAVAALLTILLKGKSGEAYNIADKDSILSIRRYAETLCRFAGVSLNFELPDCIEQKGYSKIPRSVLNAEKLEALGWRPQYTLEEGLKETLLEAARKKEKPDDSQSQ